MKTYKHYYDYAKRLATKWRHSSEKIKEKLFMKGASCKEVEQIVNNLLKEGIINDKKCFEFDIFVMEEKRYGHRRIKEYLLTKGYQKSLVDSYIYNKDIEKENCYYHFLKGKRKYENYKYSDEERQKLINYLKRCGFNDKIIFEIVKTGIIYENVM